MPRRLRRLQAKAKKVNSQQVRQLSVRECE